MAEINNKIFFQKKTWLAVAGLLLLLLILVKFFGKKPARTKVVSDVKTEIKIQQVEKNQVPANFPFDIPMETGAAITVNYNAAAPDDRTQATRGFITQKTLGENYQLYTDYFNNNGWTIFNKLDADNFKLITARKANLTATVTMNQNSATKVNTVQISVEVAGVASPK